MIRNVLYHISYQEKFRKKVKIRAGPVCNVLILFNKYIVLYNVYRDYKIYTYLVLVYFVMSTVGQRTSHIHQVSLWILPEMKTDREISYSRMRSLGFLTNSAAETWNPQTDSRRPQPSSFAAHRPINYFVKFYNSMEWMLEYVKY